MHITKIVSLAIQLGRPVHIRGEPGIGKTAFVQELARKLNYHLETIIASNHEPSDITGLPFAGKKKIGNEEKQFAFFLPIPMMRRILEMHEAGQPSILFMDEISTAPPAMQAACLRLLHERMAGDTKLPNSTLIVLASNPVGTSAGVFTLSAAMSNRMYQFDWPVSKDLWCLGMIQGFDKAEVLELPKTWKNSLIEARTMLSSYIGVKGLSSLLQQPKETTLQAEPWASPRTWEFASEALAAVLSLKLDNEETNSTILTLFSALLGEGQALEFINWFQNRDLKKPEEYLANPEKIELPERSDQLYAILNSIVSHVIHMNDMGRDNWKAAWTVLGRAAKMNKADFAAIPAQILVKNRPKTYQIPKEVAAFMPSLQKAGLIKKD